MRDRARDIVFYLAEARLDEYRKSHDLEVLGTCVGRDLVGRSYEPLFPYFADQRAQGAFVVLMDDYVTDESGTGPRASGAGIR